MSWSFLRAPRFLALSALLMAAFNLRLALTSVPPILGELGLALGLSTMELGWLSTLPVLLMGLSAPLAPYLQRRWSLEAGVALSLALLFAAQLLRVSTQLWWVFFIGTALAGAAIGVLGVLLPAWIKRDFAQQLGLLTGAYTMVLSLGAALAAGASEPLRLAFDGSWAWALVCWAGFVLPAWALMWTLHAQPPEPAELAQASLQTPLSRQLLAWQVTLFMGLQSALAYSVFSWLPSMLAARGLDAVMAGWVLSAVILVSTFTAFLAPWLSDKWPDERLMNTLSLLCYGFGIAGCWFAPLSQLWWWQALLGAGLGAGFGMALLLLVVRSPDAAVAGRLSAMAQGLGYIVAALGPLGLAYLQSHWGWAAAAVLLEIFVLLGLWMGWEAGRKRLLKAD